MSEQKYRYRVAVIRETIMDGAVIGRSTTTRLIDPGELAGYTEAGREEVVRDVAGELYQELIKNFGKAE